MRTRRTSFIAAVAMLLALVTTGPAQSSDPPPSHEMMYTQVYNCIIGPPPAPVRGEWVKDCQNEWSGWGDPPGATCTYTVATQGSACY
jgi:hypothetical protein